MTAVTATNPTNSTISPTSTPQLYANGGQTTTDTSSDAAASKLTGDFNFFLKMLTTQLKNQDPTQPMDVSQMSSQIAQYSAVEQQVQTNKNLETLISSNKQSQLSTAVSYMGLEVETEGNTSQLIDGQATFSYQLPEAAATTSVTILDGSGAAVFQGASTNLKGQNLVVWDGKNSFNGEQEPDGDYTIQVTSKDSTGATITADTRAVGTVKSVQTDASGNITLTVGDVMVPYDQILAVRLPTRVTLPDSTASNDTTTGAAASALIGMEHALMNIG